MNTHTLQNYLTWLKQRGFLTIMPGKAPLEKASAGKVLYVLEEDLAGSEELSSLFWRIHAALGLDQQQALLVTAAEPQSIAENIHSGLWAVIAFGDEAGLAVQGQQLPANIISVQSSRLSVIGQSPEDKKKLWQALQPIIAFSRGA